MAAASSEHSSSYHTYRLLGLRQKYALQAADDSGGVTGPVLTGGSVIVQSVHVRESFGRHEGEIQDLAATRSLRLSVVIPAMNEARNLPHVAARLPSVDEIVLVDGHSTDDTIAVARRLWPDVLVIPQTRRGKGNALACGFAACTGDIVVMLDADGSADPGEIYRFVEALASGADFAKGTRFTHGGGSSDLTRLRRLGNSILLTIANRLYGTAFTDLCYGYNALWRRHVPALGLQPEPVTRRLWGDGFEIETMINVRAARAGLRVTEVASFEHRRIHGASNLNAARDGFRVLRTLLVERLARR